MHNKRYLLFSVMIMSLLFFSYEANAKRGGGGGKNKTDTTPSQFTFIDQTNVERNKQINSASITITGINALTSVSISSGSEYSLDGGTSFTADFGSISNNQAVIVRVWSSGNYLSSTSATLNIGGVSDDFVVTTLSNPVDTTPDSFSFIDQFDVELISEIDSDIIAVTGINSLTVISIVGGQYSVNGSNFSSADATVNFSDSVQVRLTSSADYSAVTNAIVTIGGVNDTFSVLTKGAPVIEPGATGNPSFTSEHFSGSANCQMCHDGLSDDTGKDVSIIKAWKSTMMANATRDPLWKAKVRTELNRARDSAADSSAGDVLAGVINDKCSKCHAPMAHFEASKDNAPIEILDAGFTNANNAYHDRAMDGVSCTLCHQISDSPLLGTPEGMSGHYPVDSYANAVDRKIYGPYNNIFANPMRNNANYTPEYSAHVKESELCATCHNLKTPFTDGAGNVLPTTPEDEFPEQMPYSEWLASDYANTASADQKSCQQCHMARSNGVVMATRPMWLDTQRDDFSQHIFVGGNKFMLDMLDNNKEELGVLASDFSEIITGTENLLANAASIELISAGQAAGAVEFSLRINSNTGHKLPSAYPSRRVILHVTVKDNNDEVVFESGKVNANGSVVGLDSDMDQTKFEPHYDSISSADQVQVYEPIMHDSDGNVTYTLLRASGYVKDNRLLPNGFDKQAAPNDVKVAGAAVTDANFIGGSDEISYSLTGLTGTGYTVTVDMVYQTLAYGFVQDLFKDSSKEVSDFKRMYNASNAKVTTMTRTTFIP